MLLTKKRLSYAQQAIRSLKNLRTSEDIHFHISDDGSGQFYQHTLIDAVKETLGEVNLTISDSKDKGYGANFNRHPGYP